MVASSFQDITIGFHNAYDKTQRLNDLLDRLSSSRALTLAFWGGWTSEVHQHWLNWTDKTTHKITPQELTALGSMPDKFWQAVSGKLDLSHLTSLTLIKCDFDVLGALRKSIHSLVKLNVCCGTSLGDVRLYMLQDIFETNTELEHVHLDIHDTQLESAPRNSLYNDLLLSHHKIPFSLKERAYFWPLRHRLKSLSLNDAEFLEHCADEDVRAGYGTRLNTFVLRELNDICIHFPRLQQLEWNVFEPRTHFDMLNLLVSEDSDEQPLYFN